jgi:signal transduction histidine kinase
VDGKRDRYHLEKRYLRKDRQQVWGSVNVSLAPGEGSQRPFCLSVVEDITARRRQVEHHRQAGKMDALARMAGELVFRLNHVMLASLGSSQLLLETLPEQGAARDLLETVRDAVERSAGLTRQLMAFCARQMLNPTPVDLNALIQAQLPKVRSLAGATIEVATSFQPKLARIQADQAQLERVLLVLVQNAIEAMPAGGKLTLRTAHVDLPEHAGAEGDLPSGAHVELSVADTGRGLDEKSLERLYEPFFTTKEQGRGNGLGLAAVHGIVKQTGGHIEVESELDRGTTFRLHFPRSVETVLDVA